MKHGKKTRLRFFRLCPLFCPLFLFFAASGQDIIWEEEAENGIITGSAEIVTGCTNASGEAFVRLNANPGNSLLLDSVSMQDSGAYRLKIHYFYLGENPVEVIVNGISIGVYYLPVATWCFQGPPLEFAIDLMMKKGSNTLEFRTHDNRNAPFIDRISIQAVSKSVTILHAPATRILAGHNVDISVQIQDISPTDETVSLSISGPGSSLFSFPDSLLVIPAGKKTAYTTIIYSGLSDNINAWFQVSIDSVSRGLIIGDRDSIEIHIVNGPATFYISSSQGEDSNNGLSEESAFQTLERINACSLVPGDSILFISGDTLPGQLVIKYSGEEDAPLYYGRYGTGSRPLIDGANAPGGAFEAAVFINNCNHITIEDIEITNDRKVSRAAHDDQTGYGLQVLNNSDRVMKDLSFRNLMIRDVYAVSIDGLEFNDVQVAGIFLRSDWNGTAGKEKHIRGVTVEDCYITHTGKYGILCSHAGGGTGIGNDTLNRNMDMVFRNNHIFETGGAGITLLRACNCLVEDNTFEKTGSDHDPRMVKRGSGAWFWKCRNIIAQYNKSLHVRGYLDSYGMHIDFGNRNVFLQYNYSEDSEGGFVEILGDNVTSVYRYNISVNDGFRQELGNTIWVSRYAGRNDDSVTYIPSDSSYIYNNTIYVNGSLSPDISIQGKNTFIYNNIFYSCESAGIGEQTSISNFDGGSLVLSNNLYSGQVNSQFSSLDIHPVFGDPAFLESDAGDTSGYRLSQESIALDSGLSFTEPVFPMAGQGIFREISSSTVKDIFGNPVSLLDGLPNIGAFNGKFIDTTVVEIDTTGSDTTSTSTGILLWGNTVKVFPNPAGNYVILELFSWSTQYLKIKLVGMEGQELSCELFHVFPGRNNIRVELPENYQGTLIFLVVESPHRRVTTKIIRPPFEGR